MIKLSFTLRDFENITGIDANTLRVWKKRYGILQSSNIVAGSIRYTPEDLKYLFHVKLLLENGMRISEIVTLNRSELRDQVQAKIQVGPVTRFRDLENGLLESVMKMDEHQLIYFYSRALEELGFQKSMKQLFLPLLQKCGKLWEIGTIHVIQEHFISRFIHQKLLLAIDRLPVVNTPVEYLLFLPEPELHEIPLLFIHYFLLSTGRNTLYLGASIPYRELKHVLTHFHFSYAISGWLQTGNDDLHQMEMSKLVQNCKSTRFFLHIPEQSFQSGSSAFTPVLNKKNVTRFSDTDALQELIDREKPVHSTAI